ncbi:protein-L-isoaspartate(D-aspartate) O-methyltransferase [Mariprofundus ferrinatatus]|uniref:Protein-L-isoaspartate O-methyltransferase n=1 Tax=Mariprofundus ferrinatatus TaxID=1921087 RepID=A0A2K8L5B1_9PROT|nr:protein-L-isoaspartate(D-aspartate) O-methyltransferase [Mariprofundus ferrinatatus]ATX81041.1 protein-L-isoaspartate(D-aspartate) O-methyltransferase [Mariprofundus ferrinatatus]
MPLHDMVRDQIEHRGVHDARVLEAMRTVPRHRFVLPQDRCDAYGDFPLPIGFHQTISQPYIVAYMCELARLEPSDHVLELGTGSGYNAAVISRLVDHVYSIEIVPELARRAAEKLRQLHYDNITVRLGDGHDGWPEAAPFDAIIVTAAAEQVPQPLLDQLVEGGRLVIPVGSPFSSQELILLEKRQGVIRAAPKLPVRFVPLTGKGQTQD